MSKVAMLLVGAVVLFATVSAANAGNINTNKMLAAKAAIGPKPLSAAQAQAVFDLNSRQSSGKVNLAKQISLKRRELRGNGEDRSPLKTKRQSCVQC